MPMTSIPVGPQRVCAQPATSVMYAIGMLDSQEGEGSGPRAGDLPQVVQHIDELAPVPVGTRRRRQLGALSRIFFQRCFYLFVLLVALFILAPLVPESSEGRFAANLVNAFVVIATVAAVRRTMFSFIVVLLLAAPTLFFQWLGLSIDDPRLPAYSRMFGALLYVTTIVYLLQYVFRPDVMTADKLFGAAAAYLMLGVFWAYLYRLTGYYSPGAFAVAGQATTLEFFDALYFSITVLTSTGFGDISPLTKEARAICMIEQIVGVLFAAILIARLAGAYSEFQKR